MPGQGEYQVGICRRCGAENPLHATTCWQCQGSFEPASVWTRSSPAAGNAADSGRESLRPGSTRNTKCSFCREWIPEEAAVCRWCGRRQAAVDKPDQRRTHAAAKVKICPRCGKHNTENAWYCTCGETLSVDTIVDAASASELAQGRARHGALSGVPRSQPQYGGRTGQRVDPMREQLYWPPTSYSAGLIILAVLLGLTLLTLPISILLILQLRGQKREALVQRQRAMDRTCSVLMSKADYVGGHPSLPEAGPVVLGLTATQLTIYSLDREHAIRPQTLIPLEDIVQSGMGRPKTAREVYDDDYGHTIDVYEQSPFLRVSFTLRGDTYRASFDSFEPDAPPHMWYNQITALRYRLKSSDSARA